MTPTELIEKIKEIAMTAPELNMNNYDEDQVDDLNNAMIEIGCLLSQYFDRG